MSDALLPCPFCGSNSVMWNPVELSTGVYDDSRGFVDCISCSIRTEGKTAKDVAFAAWNRRPAAALEQAEAEGERLRGELAEVRQANNALTNESVLMGLARDAAEAALAACREALEPFAGYLDTANFDLDNKGEPLPDGQGMGWVYLTVGDFRRARAALSPTSQKEG